MFKKLPFILMTLTFVLVLAACGSKNEAGKEGAASNGSGEAATELSGNILAVGSTALQPLVEQAGQKFMAVDKYKNVMVQVQGGGSGTGLTQVSEGQATIGNSDVFAEEKLKEEAKAKELVDHQVAVVAIAPVSNKDAGVQGLTKQQLIDIFWKSEKLEGSWR